MENIKLRFNRPDGKCYPKWDYIKLENIFTEIVEKNHPELPVLSILQGTGTVLRDESDRRIEYSKNNLSNYKAMKKGDYIIHLRTFEGGLECSNHDGISSPAYKILRANALNEPLYRYYFRSHKFIVGKLSPAVVGIRDGKNIDMETFWQIEIPVPSSEEQQKIGDFLSCIDDVIANTKQELSSFEKLKEGYIQAIFSQKYRFKKTDGTSFSDWETHPLDYYLYENKTRNKNLKYTKYDVLSVSKDYGVINQIEYLGKSMAGDDLSNYHCIDIGDIVYTKSPLGKQPYGIIRSSRLEGIVSTLYAVYHCNENVIPEFIDYYFSSVNTLNRYLKPLVNIGAKHDMKVHNDVAISGLVTFPSVEEQKKIVAFLDELNNAISSIQGELEKYILLRNGIMQKMI